MKQKILIGLSAGALLLMVILTIAPNIDSRSMNTNQFNVAGNRLSIRDGVRLTNQQSGTIKDDAGVTRIILASGAASGFNDGSGASRIEADVGGSIKLKDATANSALEITSIGDAVFSHTAFLDTLLSPDLANTTGFYLSDVTYPGEILFYNNGIPTVSLSRNQSWFNAGSNYFSGVVHIVGKSIFDGTVNSTGTGGSLISQTASNGLGIVNIRPDFTMANTQTVVWPTNLPAVGQHLGVKATNWYGTTNLEIQTEWQTPSSSSLFITNGHLVTVSNSVSITDLLDVTIPANTIPTNGCVEVLATGRILVSGPSFAPTNYVYFGGSNVYSGLSASLASASNWKTFSTKLYLVNQDSASRQSLTVEQLISGGNSVALPGSGLLNTAGNAITEAGITGVEFAFDTTTNNELKLSIALTNGVVAVVCNPVRVKVMK